MTPTTLAETILRDVPRYAYVYNSDNCEWELSLRENGGYLSHADILAALTAAMDPAIAERAGEVLERLQAEKSVVSTTRTFPSGDERDMVLVPHYGPNPLANAAADLITALLAQLAALRAERDEATITQVWIAGEPPKHIRDEWFIAKTIHGDRVVLRALPEEWGYDYKTADETHMAARNIAAWMQMPDSGYVSYVEGGAVTAEAVARAEAAEAQIAALTARVEGLTGALDAIYEITVEPAETDHKNVRGWIEVTARAALSTTEASHE